MKKRTILFFILLLISSKIIAQKSKEDAYKNLIEYAMKLYDSQEYQKSKKHFMDAFEITSDNEIDLYNAACSSALAGDTSTALELLKKSILNGYNNPDHMEKDRDLCALKFEKSWNKLVEMAKENKDVEAVTLKKISHHIKHLNIEYLMEMGTDSFKIRYNEKDLIQSIKVIKEMMETRKKANLHDIKKQNISWKHKTKNGITNNSVRYSFRFFPDYYGPGTNDWVKPNDGDKIDLSFNKEKNKMLLDELVYESAYAKPTFDFITYLKDFFYHVEPYSVKINAVTKSGDETNLLQYYKKDNTLDESRLIMLLSDAKYMRKKEISIGNTRLKRINIVLEKKIPLDSTNLIKPKIPFDLFNKTKSLAFIITFALDDNNQILLATTDKYAFYQIKDKKALKDFCLNYFSLP